MADTSVNPKRIIICCDGTWQSSVSGEENVPSNVTRLCRNLARTGKGNDGRLWQQLVYYDSGVGTGSLTSVEKSRQGAVGDGLAVNVIEAYNFIVLNYSPGDEIFCFGFSRGAYTARAVAGLVADLGVIEPGTMQTFPEIYQIYKKNIPTKENGYAPKRFRDTQGWKDFVDGKKATTPEAIKLWAELEKQWRRTTAEENRIMWEIPSHGDPTPDPESRNVKVVGVWDTVGALGIPDGRWTNNSSSRTEQEFHNVKLSKNIEHAFQALALDERRKAFSPTLWYLSEDCPNIDDRLLQVWFPGVHINIGGGSSDTAEGKGDAEQMANITFAWMMECVRPYLAFNENTINRSLIEHTNLLEAIHCKNNHNHDPSKVSSLPVRAAKGIYNSLPSIWEEPPQAPLSVGWGTADFVDSYQGMMAWAGEARRQPGECTTEVVAENDSMIWKYMYHEAMKKKDLKDLGITNEQVHPVARFRREKKVNKGKKDAGGLEGWTPRAKLGSKGYEWYKTNSKGEELVLKEYVIKEGPGNIERLIASNAQGVSPWLRETDIINGIPVDKW